jgi:hypothetical protein
MNVVGKSYNPPTHNSGILCKSISNSVVKMEKIAIFSYFGLFFFFFFLFFLLQHNSLGLAIIP